ncbi:MAG: C39 family peptidase [Candidatus Pacebacteria bacterium]|nr:C39 family peptidase [Candidatus Paceibacterota bacterium]MDR3582914.1 C39 family peptidase [Candidatus Paceibacterota bacterium]
MSKSKLFIVCSVLLVILVGVVFCFSNSYSKVIFPATKNISQNVEQPAVSKAVENITKRADLKNNNQGNENNSPVGKADVAVNNFPAEIKINVPFTSQAPLGVWDQYHEEACEETTLVMLEYYLKHKPLTPKIAEDQIQKMIAFEIKNYGDYKDTNAEQTVNLFNAFYGPLPARNASPARVTRVGVSGGRSDAGGPSGKKLAVIYNFSKQEIKNWLAKGNPVIVPAAGRELANPYFTPPGPLYHNLVLIGYDGDKIITNDPGTKHGAGYTYDIGALYNAIHDFPGKPEDIDQGRKAMIVVE